MKNQQFLSLHGCFHRSLNDRLSAIKKFLNIHSSPLNIPSLPTLMINYIKSGQNWFCSNTLQSYPGLKGLRKPFESLIFLCHTHIQFYKQIIQRCSHLVHRAPFSPLILPCKIIYIYS